MFSVLSVRTGLFTVSGQCETIIHIEAYLEVVR